ncbi:hypothetical protein DAEQUDRAFT_723051 [Daedalea quercina L-15889]|uniref:Uncharacterized protein n=1 Tax=Daedalea quercina L-15889 TaxID=1314783 RepID=A0A165SQU3_9APHY|nr:hypothetical protein DAEQUDRAFT_723051 [Daedalea quercina L-15889]
MPAFATAALCSTLAGLGLSDPALAAMCSLAEYNQNTSREARKVSDWYGSSAEEGSALPSPSAEEIVYPRGKARATKVSHLCMMEAGDENEDGYEAGSESDPDALARMQHLQSKRRRSSSRASSTLNEGSASSGSKAHVGLGLGLPVGVPSAPHRRPAYTFEVDSVLQSPVYITERDNCRPPAGQTWDSWPPVAPSPSLLPSPTLAFGPPQTWPSPRSPAWPPVSMAPSPSMLPSPRFAFMGTPRRPAWPPVAPSPSMLPTPVF